jgi:hypothetical protein
MTHRHSRINEILAISDMKTRVEELARHVLKGRVSDPGHWMDGHHPILGGLTPNEAVTEGRGAEVMRILLNIEFSLPS